MLVDSSLDSSLTLLKAAALRILQALFDVARSEFTCTSGLLALAFSEPIQTFPLSLITEVHSSQASLA